MGIAECYSQVIMKLFFVLVVLICMMKVLFLDFDGVLNTEDYQKKLREEGEKQYDEYGQIFDPTAINNLKYVLEAIPDVRLVINSSWKLEGFDRINELWRARKLPGILYGVTPDYVPDLSKYDLSNDNNIEMLACKGYEVKQWLNENAPNGCRYVIFDDVPDFLPEQVPFLICTDPSKGITKEDSTRAIRILS